MSLQRPVHSVGGLLGCWPGCSRHSAADRRAGRSSSDLLSSGLTQGEISWSDQLEQVWSDSQLWISHTFIMRNARCKSEINSLWLSGSIQRCVLVKPVIHTMVTWERRGWSGYWHWCSWRWDWAWPAGASAASNRCWASWGPGRWLVCPGLLSSDSR